MAHTPRIGSIQVDFAGTQQEAKVYAESKYYCFPAGLTAPTNVNRKYLGEFPILRAKVIRIEQVREVQNAFDSLGWDKGSQWNIVY